jgi:hypothetical protein
MNITCFSMVPPWLPPGAELYGFSVTQRVFNGTILGTSCQAVGGDPRTAAHDK